MDTNKKTDEQKPDPVVLSEGLAKSLGALKALLPGGKEELSKAKHKEPDADNRGGASDNDEDNEEDGEGGDDDYEEDDEGEDLKKSLVDLVAEDDPESEIAMDVAPFLKSLANGMEALITQKFSQLEKSIRRDFNKGYELQKAMGALVASQAELTKSINLEVRTIGNAPVPSASAVRSATQRFGDKPTEMTGAQILQKSQELLIAKKIDPVAATKIVHRVNNGQSIPAELEYLFK